MTHGHHRSTLLTPEVPFASRMQMMDAGEVAVVAIDGCSAIRLERSQPEDRVVLWLPRQGWVAERVNGEAVVAESGSAMLYLPGDELCGDTSLRLQGFSILLPFDQLGDPGAWSRCCQRHLEGGREVVALIETALDLVGRLRGGVGDPRFACSALAEQLLYWHDLRLDEAESGPRADAVDRRRLIRRARDWIDAHRAEPFRVSELAAALYVAPRTLQLAFREELGHPPLVEARRLRFRALRQALLAPAPSPRSLEVLLASHGLPCTPLTRRQYLEWCGETPQESRARGLGLVPRAARHHVT
jgi:AraC-like DNA-binding protein